MLAEPLHISTSFPIHFTSHKGCVHQWSPSHTKVDDNKIQVTCTCTSNVFISSFLPSVNQTSDAEHTTPASTITTKVRFYWTILIGVIITVALIILYPKNIHVGWHLSHKGLLVHHITWWIMKVIFTTLPLRILCTLLPDRSIKAFYGLKMLRLLYTVMLRLQEFCIHYINQLPQQPL